MQLVKIYLYYMHVLEQSGGHNFQNTLIATVLATALLMRAGFHIYGTLTGGGRAEAHLVLV